MPWILKRGRAAHLPGLAACLLLGACELTSETEELFHLTITNGGTGFGAVVVSPEGTDHPPGTEVTLTADPDAGSAFLEWEGDCTGTTNPCALTMDRDYAVKAIFVRLVSLTLNTAGAGTGSIAASPPGSMQTLDATVTITATPAAGSVFIGWKDDCATATTNPCTLQMSADRVVTGTFNVSTGAGRYDGEYDGTWNGLQSSGDVLDGLIAFTVTNGVLQGTLSPISGSQKTFTGTVSAGGAITATIAFAQDGCAVNLSGQITTSVSGGIERATANGSYALVTSSSCNAGSGSWTLSR